MQRERLAGRVAETGQRWGHCTRQAGWGLNSQIHAVGDGAEWIRIQCQEVFAEQATFLCDFFHVSEYLGAAAQTTRPAQPDQWRRTQQQRLRRGAVQKVIASLAEHLEPVGTPEEEAPVRNGHRYLTNRLDCLDYPRALELGLPIGSGMIEAGAKRWIIDIPTFEAEGYVWEDVKFVSCIYLHNDSGPFLNGDGCAP